MMKKPWESQKGKTTQETQKLGSMPNSKEKVINEDDQPK